MDDNQSINTVKSSEEKTFVDKLRNLFPAIEIRVEHVCTQIVDLFSH